jgi:ABC-type oligopeptide transport system ATPase subunit
MSKILSQSPKILEVKNLCVSFDLPKKTIFSRSQKIRILKDIQFDLDEGDILGIVGESGSGKSTLARTIMNLNPIESGEIVYKGLHQKEYKMQWYHHFQMIFQDPLDSMNSRMMIKNILSEPLEIQKTFDKKTINKMVLGSLDEVGLGEEILNRFPHEFSGGQLQRIGIARALLMNPSVLICDECLSALDASVQSQVMNLFLKLHQKRQLTFVFISHDMSVVRHLANKIIVMKDGKIVEDGFSEEIFQSPKKDYTRELLSYI